MYKTHKTKQSGHGKVTRGRPFQPKGPNDHESDGVTATIQLGNGLSAIIDAADYPLVRPHRWHASNGTGKRKSYPRTSIGGKKVCMHQVLLGSGAPMPDHKDGNGLNNRRDNLRPATPSENACNRRKRKGRSAYKGVFWIPSSGRWVSRIAINGKRFGLGVFGSEAQTARAYDAAARRLQGEFAWLNFPDPVELINRQWVSGIDIRYGCERWTYRAHSLDVDVYGPDSAYPGFRINSRANKVVHQTLDEAQDAALDILSAELKELTMRGRVPARPNFPAVAA